MKSKFEIVVIGAGNMATRLSLALVEKGYTIKQVYSRTTQSAQMLATRLGGDVTFTNDTGSIYPDADLYLFSLSDNALAIPLATCETPKVCVRRVR